MRESFILKREPVGAVVVLTGPSGAGKSTLVEHAQALLPDLAFSVSHTTRPPRPGEVDGVHYHFATEQQFRAELQKSGFVEHAQVHGNLYGTHRSELDRARAEGGILLLDIDVQGARQLRDRSVADAFMFIMPPSLDELERRLRGRGTEGEDAVRRRLRNAHDEIRDCAWFDLIVVNDDVVLATEELVAALRTCRLRLRSRAHLESMGLTDARAKEKLTRG